MSGGEANDKRSSRRIEVWEVTPPPPPRLDLDETSVEETKVEETKVEEAKFEEAKVEEPKVDEAKFEEAKPPILLCKLIVNYPRTAFVIGLSVYVLAFLISGALIAQGYDLFPVEFTKVPLTHYNDPAQQRFYAWKHRREGAPGLVERVPTSFLIRSNRSIPADSLDLVFETKDGSNIFTPSHLGAMQKIQNELLATKQFSTFCLLASGSCAVPMSPLNYFDGTFAAENSAWNDSNFQAIATALYTAYTNANHSSRVRFFLGIEAKVGPTLVSSPITRIRLRFGFPLESGGTEKEQTDRLKAFLIGEPLKVVKRYHESPPSGLNVFYYSQLVYSVEVVAQAFKDMALAGGSFLFIFIFVCVQTQSAWIGGWTIFSILGAFIITNLIYRCIIGFRYFGFFHVLSIFIILGIGADDVFIFVDTWRASGHRSFSSLEHRFSFTYRRAAVAMAVTSATTMAAFLVSATSPLIAINSFGAFSAILVLIDYVGVITFFPTVLMLHHQHVRHWCCGTRQETGAVGPLEVESAGGEKNKAELEGTESDEKKNVFVRFFKGPFFRFITHKVARWIILVVFFLALIACGLLLTGLRPTDETVKIYKDGHNYAKIDRHTVWNFMSSTTASLVKVQLVWGLKRQDMSACDYSNISCTGRTRFDAGFDLNSASAQLGLLRLCRTLERPSPQLRSSLKIQVSSDNYTDVSCFMTELETYLQTLNLSLPLNETNVRPFMTARPAIYGAPSTWPSNFTRYFEVMLTFWLTNGYTFRLTDNFMDFNSLLGETRTENTRNVSLPGLPFPAYWGTRLQFAAIEVTLTLNTKTLGYPRGLPVSEEWETFMTEQLALLPAGLQDGFMTSSAWPWLLTQWLLVDSALIGLLIGVILAFLILTAATCNILVALVATLCIAVVTAWVMAVIATAGWKLGVLESINMSLVVGLAVDYVVHFAEAYNDSPHSDRLQRVRDALELVGVSVLSGATTTLGAALFMLFSQILFFVQFGAFLFCTISFSFIIALGFFCTFMALCGPQGTTGSCLCKRK